MSGLYTEGDYLENTKTWHMEDSAWKAAKIDQILQKNSVRPNTAAEVGCGAGRILYELSNKKQYQFTSFEGYDISPQAISIATPMQKPLLKFFHKDLFEAKDSRTFDLLLAIDVLEHVPDYFGFLNNCVKRAKWKVYHIPLDIHVSSVLRNSFLHQRKSIGHIHYFTAESALATLVDTGHEIVDSCFTDGAVGLFREHPSFRTGLANIPRVLLGKISERYAARILGGYSLLVLTR